MKTWETGGLLKTVAIFLGGKNMKYLIYETRTENEIATAYSLDFAKRIRILYIAGLTEEDAKTVSIYEIDEENDVMTLIEED